MFEGKTDAMRRRTRNELVEIVAALIEYAEQSDWDAFTSENLPHVAQGAEDISRLHWGEWDAVIATLPVDDVVALFKIMVVLGREAHWSGGSVAAPIWIYRELLRRDQVLGLSMADWALARTNNPYVPFGTQNGGARSLQEWNEFQIRKAEWKAENLERERRQAEEAARKRQEKQKAHQERMARQAGETQHRRQLIAQMDSISLSERLCYIAEDDTHHISFYPEAFAEISDTELAAMSSDILHKLQTKLAKSGLRGWKRLHRRLMNRE